MNRGKVPLPCQERTISPLHDDTHTPSLVVPLSSESTNSAGSSFSFLLPTARRSRVHTSPPHRPAVVGPIWSCGYSALCFCCQQLWRPYARDSIFLVTELLLSSSVLSERFLIATLSSQAGRFARIKTKIQSLSTPIRSRRQPQSYRTPTPSSRLHARRRKMGTGPSLARGILG